jgi:hypothetical protein
VVEKAVLRHVVGSARAKDSPHFDAPIAGTKAGDLKGVRPQADNEERSGNDGQRQEYRELEERRAEFAESGDKGLDLTAGRVGMSGKASDVVAKQVDDAKADERRAEAEEEAAITSRRLVADRFWACCSIPPDLAPRESQQKHTSGVSPAGLQSVSTVTEVNQHR